MHHGRSIGGGPSGEGSQHWARKWMRAAGWSAGLRHQSTARGRFWLGESPWVMHSPCSPGAGRNRRMARGLGSRGSSGGRGGNGGAGPRGGQLPRGLRARRGRPGPSLGDPVAPPHAAAALCLDLWFPISHLQLRLFACISPQKARENDALTFYLQN